MPCGQGHWGCGDVVQERGHAYQETQIMVQRKVKDRGCHYQACCISTVNIFFSRKVFLSEYQTLISHHVEDDTGCQEGRVQEISGEGRSAGAPHQVSCFGEIDCWSIIRILKIQMDIDKRMTRE